MSSPTSESVRASMTQENRAALNVNSRYVMKLSGALLQFFLNMSANMETSTIAPNENIQRRGILFSFVLTSELK